MYTTCDECGEVHECERYELEKNDTYVLLWLCNTCVDYLEDEGIDVFLEP